MEGLMVKDQLRTEELVADLWYCYPRVGHAVTMSKCSTQLCKRGARGGRFCSVCLEHQLAQLIQPRLANRFHVAIRKLRAVECTVPQDLNERAQTAISNIWSNQSNRQTKKPQLCAQCKVNIARNCDSCSLCAVAVLKAELPRSMPERLFRAIVEVVQAERVIKVLFIEKAI
jgi:hypothetical protein